MVYILLSNGIVTGYNMRYNPSMYRSHVHNMITIIQFRKNNHTVLEGQQHVYCIHGNSGLENSYCLALYASIETLIPQALPSGKLFLYCILLLQTLGSWSITTIAFTL